MFGCKKGLVPRTFHRQLVENKVTYRFKFLHRQWELRIQQIKYKRKITVYRIGTFLAFVVLKKVASSLSYLSTFLSIPWMFSCFKLSFSTRCCESFYYVPSRTGVPPTFKIFTLVLPTIHNFTESNQLHDRPKYLRKAQNLVMRWCLYISELTCSMHKKTQTEIKNKLHLFNKVTRDHFQEQKLPETNNISKHNVMFSLISVLL